MDTFLGGTASYLYNKYGDSLSDCALVFPNRRAGLFFTRHLSGLIDKPLWLPRVMNISDLMLSISSLQKADPITLNFELYHIYRSVTGSQESFDEFYNWGEVLLSDFDEIDKYMVDAQALFRNVTELKKIEEQFDYMTPTQVEAVKSFWSTFSSGSRSPEQREFLFIWEVLAKLYVNYREHLIKNRIAYEGMIFRDVASKIESGGIPDLPYHKLFIAGFNALNECEKIFFDYLQKAGKVEFLWDYDDYYVSGQNHQAGLFMKENLKRYPHTGFSPETGSIEKNKPDIEILAVPSNSGQAKMLPGLKDIFSSDDPVKTAVVLPDESLLLPVLSSLPEEVADINVTMGYPLRENPVYGLVLLLISLQRNSRVDSGGRLLFHHSDVIALLQHPGLCELITGSSAVVKEIGARNLVYTEAQDLGATKAGALVFRRITAGLPFMDYIIDILTLIAQNVSAKEDKGKEDKSKEDKSKEDRGKEDKGNGDEIGVGDSNQGSVGFPEREFIFRLLTGINRLKDILRGSGTEIRMETLAKLLKKVLQGIRIPFHGEPLGGVQVMGVLETRALDFENVVWLSMNEGVFPARQSNISFVPYSLRKGYGLPGNDQHEAVYAYYFYRMIQRAGRTVLICNTRSDGLFTGEMSRFIYQLKFDPRFNVREKTLVSNLLPGADRPVVIDKNPGVMDVLDRFTGDGQGKKYLSPAAINAFADCSLRFYFRYIARLPEPAKVTEEIDMAVFGNLLHKSAQYIYEPFTGKDVQVADIDKLLKDDAQLEKIVRASFDGVLSGSEGNKDELTGMNSIIGGVLITYLKEMLTRDRQLAPFRIEALEEEYRASVLVNIEGERNINLGGIIDRVDEVRGTRRVVDYKTGGDEPDFKTLDSLFELGNPRRRKAVFQTFLYAWLYLENSESSVPVSPVIYQVKKFFGKEPLVIYEKPSRSVSNVVNDFAIYRDEFTGHLNQLLTSLFDRNVPFKQVEDTEICKYCIYRKLCNR